MSEDVAVTPRYLTYEPVDEVEPAELNPKNHDLPGLVASMRRFGFTAPGLRDERTGRLVVGHGRRDAVRELREAGEDPPSGVIVTDDGVWKIPVIRGWASNSDLEASAYLIADNRHAEQGGWDTSLLAEILADFDTDLTIAAGYTTDEVDQLVANTNAALPEGFEFPEYDENTGKDSKDAKTRVVTCPHCGEDFTP